MAAPGSNTTSQLPSPFAEFDEAITEPCREVRSSGVVFYESVFGIAMLVSVVIGASVGITLRFLFKERWSPRHVMYLAFPGELLSLMLRETALPLSASSVIAAAGSMERPLARRVARHAISYVLLVKAASQGCAVLATFTVQPGRAVEPGDVQRLLEAVPPQARLVERSNGTADAFSDMARQHERAPIPPPASGAPGGRVGFLRHAGVRALERPGRRTAGLLHRPQQRHDAGRTPGARVRPLRGVLHDGRVLRAGTEPTADGVAPGPVPVHGGAGAGHARPAGAAPNGDGGHQAQLPRPHLPRCSPAPPLPEHGFRPGHRAGHHCSAGGAPAPGPQNRAAASACAGRPGGERNFNLRHRQRPVLRPHEDGQHRAIDGALRVPTLRALQHGHADRWRSWVPEAPPDPGDRRHADGIRWHPLRHRLDCGSVGNRG